MVDRLYKFLKKLGVDIDEKKDVIDEEAKELLESAKPAQATIDLKANEQIQALEKRLNDVINALTEERKVREEATKVVQEQLKAEQDKRRKDLLDTAIKEKKITPAQRDGWDKLLQVDYESAAAVINSLPVHPVAVPKDSKPVKSESQVKGDYLVNRAGYLKEAREELMNKL